jgi:hypothetical protein
VPFSRRTFVESATLAVVASLIARLGFAVDHPHKNRRLFNGRNLAGWIQIQNGDFSFSHSQIAEPPALATALRNRATAAAALIDERLSDSLQAALSESDNDPDALASKLARELNAILAGPCIYQGGAFNGVKLRSETTRLLRTKPAGSDLVRLNKLLIEDAFPAELKRSPPLGWMVKHGSITSTGAGRGVIYTAKEFNRFRLRFTMRHVSGSPDHQACVLIFCTRPVAEAVPIDALGGIQFQVPNGGHWDYRPGHNNAGEGEFTRMGNPQFDVHEWCVVELIADAAKGIARMAVAQPAASKAVEVLAFNDAGAGKVGPIALQMHNAGLFDEYKDIEIDDDPADFNLVAVDA